MHLNFHFTAAQVLWTLTFAALLVLLVVLLGRDRGRRFAWFTTSVVLAALNLLVSHLLYGRLPQLTMGAVLIILADAAAVITLLVLIEMARWAFVGANRIAWLIGVVALVTSSALVAAFWGPWPAWKTLTANSTIARLSDLQLFAQKLGLFNDVATLGLGLLVILLGRRYGAGRHSHTQQIVIGLSTASMSQIVIQIVWQAIAGHAVPHSMAEYDRVVGLREKLINANSAVYVAVLIWWIARLWVDEPVPTQLPTPGSGARGTVAGLEP